MASRPVVSGASAGMEIYWYRLAIDLDPAGYPIGISYEVRKGERIEKIHVLPRPAPKSYAHDELETLLEDVYKRYGLLVPLF